ncbi:MAG: sigma factor [Intestinimonas sp.]
MTEQEYAVRADAMKGKLYGMALLYLGSASLAVDAVDEAVYKGLRACEKLREEQFFGTWLTRILINVCNAELRRHRREVSVAELPETAQEDFDALPLRDAVGRLPRELKEVIILRYFSGLTLRRPPAPWISPRGRRPPGRERRSGSCAWSLWMERRWAHEPKRGILGPGRRTGGDAACAGRHRRAGPCPGP